MAMERIKFGTFCLGIFLFGFFGIEQVQAEKGSKGIEVQVEVTEVDQAKASELGVEWIKNLALSEKSPAKLVSVGSFAREPGLRADIHFLIQEGAAELLANPNLMTDSDTTASFHAGGEIPYMTSASLGSTHVEFKPYGVSLEFHPKLVGSDRIEMKIRAIVSSPDQTQGVTLSGNSVPALLEREVSSNVTLQNERTITLAGLVQTQKDDMTQGVPILRRLPLIGALFRWKRSIMRKTTIVMFVTPKLIDL